MAQQRFWAELGTNNICFNTVWSEDPNFISDPAWIEFTPSEELSEIIGMEYKADGTWVEPVDE